MVAAEAPRSAHAGNGGVGAPVGFVAAQPKEKLVKKRGVIYLPFRFLWISMKHLGWAAFVLVAAIITAPSTYCLSLIAGVPVWWSGAWMLVLHDLDVAMDFRVKLSHLHVAKSQVQNPVHSAA